MSLQKFSEIEYKLIGEGISYAMECCKEEPINTYGVIISKHPEFIVSVKNANEKFYEGISEGIYVYCMVQYWDDNTIQMRYQGGFSEFIKI